MFANCISGTRLSSEICINPDIFFCSDKKKKDTMPLLNFWSNFDMAIPQLKHVLVPDRVRQILHNREYSALTQL